MRLVGVSRDASSPASRTAGGSGIVLRKSSAAVALRFANASLSFPNANSFLVERLLLAKKNRDYQRRGRDSKPAVGLCPTPASGDASTRGSSPRNVTNGVVV